MFLNVTNNKWVMHIVRNELTSWQWHIYRSNQGIRWLRPRAPGSANEILETFWLARHFAFLVLHVYNVTFFMSYQFGLHPGLQFPLRQTTGGMSYKSHKSHRFQEIEMKLRFLYAGNHNTMSIGHPFPTIVKESYTGALNHCLLKF